MKRSKFIVVILCLVFGGIKLMGQEIDTLHIYQKNTGYSIKKYQKVLLGKNKDNSFLHSRLDSLDKKFFFSDTIKPIYVILHNKDNNIILEGNLGLGYSKRLVGRILIYYKNGSIKEERFIANGPSCENNFLEKENVYVLVSDGLTPWGDWKFYDKNSNLVKEVRYSCESDNSSKTISVIKKEFNRKKNKIKVSRKVIYSL